jgi:hypothetical protein
MQTFLARISRMLTPRKRRAIALLGVVLIFVSASALGWIPLQIAIAWIKYVAWFLNFISPAATWIATAVIAWFTGTIYRINQDQLKHSRKAERAYVSGSAIVEYIQVPGTNGGVVQGAPRWLSVVVSNNGKTPAYVTGIAVNLCSDSGLPKPANLEQNYKQSTFLVDRWVSPGAKDEPTKLGFDFEVARGKIVYGRVYYVDIFQELHSSGFILRVLSRGTAAFEAPAEYISWN